MSVSNANPSSGDLGTVPVVEADRIAQVLPMEDAIDVLDRAFAAGLPTAPMRTSHRAGGSELIVMPAWSTVNIGIKLVTMNRDNLRRGKPSIHAIYLLFDAISGEPKAFIDGSGLTAIRTAATSAVATRYLADPKAHRLVIFGAGRQGEAHLQAMRAVRPLTECIVIDPSSERAAQLVRSASAMGVRASIGTPSAVSGADIICTCSTSAKPLFDGNLLPSQVHINAIGAYRPDLRELDSVTVASAQVWVEDRGAAMEEAGDLIQAQEEGVFSAASITGDLTDLCSGRVTARSEGKPRTLYKGVGVAGEDLVVAGEVLRRLGRTG